MLQVYLIVMLVCCDMGIYLKKKLWQEIIFVLAKYFLSLSLFGWRDVGENDDLAMVVAMIKKVHCTFTFIYNDIWD